jgi:hypothetical protein
MTVSHIITILSTCDFIEVHESKKRELIEETLKKLDIGDEDLEELEKVRGEVWKKEKKKLRLSS